MDGAYTAFPKQPTIADLLKLVKKDDKPCNISVYDAEADEYYPVELVYRATEDNDVLDEDHLILAIKIPQAGGQGA